MDRATKTLSGQEAFVMRSNGLDPLPVWCISCDGFSGLYTTCEVVATSGVLCEHCMEEYQRELDDIERTRLPFAGEQGDW